MTLWVSNGGVITCANHGGAYLQAAVEARPKARRHTTPLDVWDLMLTPEGGDLRDA